MQIRHLLKVWVKWLLSGVPIAIVLFVLLLQKPTAVVADASSEYFVERGMTYHATTVLELFGYWAIFSAGAVIFIELAKWALHKFHQSKTK